MPTESTSAAAKIGDLAAEAGITRIHVLAWRDLYDVEAGGSEVHADQVLTRWAAAGLDVTMRTSHAQGQPPEEVRNGYRVVRRAGRYLVFPRAVAAELSGRVGPRDAVVEIWNGMPFFTPLWAPRPRLTLLHHVHAEMWGMVLPDNLAKLGDTVERRVAPWLYRRTDIATLADSSRHELITQLGLRPERVHVVPPGIDPRFTPSGPTSPTPLAVAVGRLMPVKRYDMLIRAVSEARRVVPDLRLVIVGEGPLRGELERLIDELGLVGAVQLVGRRSEDELVALYREAWLVVSASAKEGWGMTLTEAAACGTPAVATRISGHVDSVRHGESGYLADPHDPVSLAEHINRVVTEPHTRTRLARGARAHAESLTWDRTATELMQILAGDGRRRRRR